jgi:hypothetical protein
MSSHIYICMCDVFCVLYVFFVLCLIPKVLYRSIMALLWTRGEGNYISRTANLRKISVIAPLDIKIPARLRPGKSALLPTSGRNRSCPPPESAKLRDFFLHAATRWHSARYVRSKRNSRKFLQNFFAKNLVCVPKVRTFALANQK